jgi:hypothetical protein
MTVSYAEARSKVERLVERFTRHLDAYRRADYKEAQVRTEFIDPLFEALGWDVRNVQGYAEQYKDVIHEDAIKVGGATRAPDYCFRVGGVRKFFLEAKKPSVWVKGELGPAYQLRRYAWSAKLPLSILTDFEEFAVYDCLQRPGPADKPGVGRVTYLTFDQYPERFDDVYGIFGKESVLQGSFDRYVQDTKRKRGTSEVDAEFLKEIEGWRDALARNVALRNPALSVYELNYAVQRTIDRLIFLRMCEDRGVEDYGRLLALTGGPDIYARLGELYRQADEKYDSDLFDFQADTLSKSLAVDDRVLKPILAGLYYPQSPYEFSVLPTEILGQVYEQFLGKVIRLTAGHRAVVEEKPEVKKAGGVYYTPAYIVDYIVRQTVGRLVEDKSPRQVSRLRILDGACGSGSFLLGAYQYLLDYHLRWYEAHEPARHAQGRQPAVYQGSHGEWRLTTAEKKRILVNNVYGVDVDRQAVEVTKLSLLLKVLEGENQETLGQQLALWRERALPDLASNIKCGNSLIGPGYFEGQLMPDEEEMRRVNPFDWEAEFPEVMAAGGFDVVIGNPPYIRSQSLGDKQREYYKRKYTAATRTYDIYVLFVEKTIDLLNETGRSGFILPNKFFTTDYGEGLRRILGSQKIVEKLVDFEDGQVFEGAGTYTTLLFLSRPPVRQPEYARLGKVFRESGRNGLREALTSSDLAFAPINLTDDGSRWTLAVGHTGAVLMRLQQSFPALAKYHLHVFQGLKTSADKVYILKAKQTTGTEWIVTNGLGETFAIECELLRPMVKGEHVQRFHTDTSNGLYVLYPYTVTSGRVAIISQDDLAAKYPKAWEYLNNNYQTLGARDRGLWSKRTDWYAYARSQNIGTFIGPKFLIPYMTTRLRANYDDAGTLFFVNITTGGYGLRVELTQENPKYILGLLNSSLLNHCIQQMTNRFRGGYFAVNKQSLERLPTCPINFSDPADVARHDRMVALVERMLELHKKLAAATIPADKTLYQRQIEATDRQIDALVYELYGLTEEEIAIVEGRS